MSRVETVSVDEQITQVSRLLQEAAETHHTVFRIVDGADDDWASWYSEWLITLSELPDFLGVKPVRSELTYMLVRLNREYVEQRPEESWQDYYAQALVQHFAPARPTP
jgi:hypothetical protein